MNGQTVQVRWSIALGPATLTDAGWEPNRATRIHPDDVCVVVGGTGKRLLIRCDGGQAWVDRSAIEPTPGIPSDSPIPKKK